MIITVPTGQLCIKSDAPEAIKAPFRERTPYEVMQEIGPALLAAFFSAPRGPPKAA